ncbi:MAG: 50S ribosomal protein L5 [Acholeplasma sp.]|nr:50S ribosomal protein L5 [Acholeplasma sp.]
MSRLKEKYENIVKPELIKEFNYTSVMEAPRLEKIVINMGLGDAVANSKIIDDAVEELRTLTGQQPVVTKAKKSVSNFKLRDGMPIGAKVTLRGEKMYHFLDKLVSIALPRVRDFRGVSSNAFDGRGNYTLGVKEQIIFPEINLDKIKKVRGMDIVIVTTANTDQECFALLKHLGMPFKK